MTKPTQNPEQYQEQESTENAPDPRTEVQNNTENALGKLRKQTERNKIKPTEFKIGTLHTQYQEKVGKYTNEKITENRNILANASIKDIISRNDLLSEEGNIHEKLESSSSARLSAYTSSHEGEWYTLDYKQVGGMKHELNIGLADVITDPAVENVLIMKDGETIKAHRDIVKSGKHQGRVGFVNDETGEYIATYTGDKFQILDNKLEIDEATEEDYQKVAEQEAIARQKFAETFKEVTTSTENPSMYDVVLEEKSLYDQVNLNHIKEENTEKVKNNIKIIEDTFIANGYSKKIAAAAIANAWVESGGLNENAVGDGGHSVGLFQLNDRGAGKGLSEEERKDPKKNTEYIISRSKRSLDRLVEAEKNGASLPELVILFSKYVERPGIPHNDQRIAALYNLFPNKVLKENLKDFTTPEGLPALISLKENEPAIFGSSTARNLADKTNVFGIGGAGPEVFLKNLKFLWPQIEKQKPSKVILAGLAVNGLKQKGKDTVEQQLSKYMEIVGFLEAKGITVKISTLQPYKPKKETILAFNTELRTNPKYSKYIVDTAASITTANNEWKEGMNASDNLHMSSQGEKAFMETVNNQA
ncbi:hypothetical protein COU74_03895 [Candidatus Peregrinibacteria bacterium CG10_big_fil_rev_8_21_14_0_10_36_19]|nr:MAG: hypothetical protein COU74_03895 [Candidatus Peregrinibacteria bacterium CG10_big_fil_rev_8_21_14_0_10_36_19]